MRDSTKYLVADAAVKTSAASSQSVKSESKGGNKSEQWRGHGHRRDSFQHPK